MREFLKRPLIGTLILLDQILVKTLVYILGKSYTYDRYTIRLCKKMTNFSQSIFDIMYKLDLVKYEIGVNLPHTEV